MLNTNAAAAILWTSGQLTSAEKAYLDNLPESLETGDFMLVHGSPRNPVNEYIMSNSIARENFTFFKSMYCLAGHTHEPMVYSLDKDGICSAGRFSPNVKLSVGRNRLIINPGSVGQPRDGIPDASYAIYDSETGIMQLRRVAYDIKTTQDRMMEYGLPARLVMRLERGE
jgi:diadenosine tetraphosphatase ApaH/serine/threonine PP2A family protein phosphatase